VTIYDHIYQHFVLKMKKTPLFVNYVLVHLHFFGLNTSQFPDSCCLELLP